MMVVGTHDAPRRCLLCCGVVVDAGGFLDVGVMWYGDGLVTHNSRLCCVFCVRWWWLFCCTTPHHQPFVKTSFCRYVCVTHQRVHSAVYTFWCVHQQTVWALSTHRATQLTNHPRKHIGTDDECFGIDKYTTPTNTDKRDILSKRYTSHITVVHHTASYNINKHNNAQIYAALGTGRLLTQIANMMRVGHHKIPIISWYIDCCVWHTKTLRKCVTKCNEHSELFSWVEIMLGSCSIAGRCSMFLLLSHSTMNITNIVQSKMCSMKHCSRRILYTALSKTSALLPSICVTCVWDMLSSFATPLPCCASCAHSPTQHIV